MKQEINTKEDYNIRLAALCIARNSVSIAQSLNSNQLSELADAQSQYEEATRQLQMLENKRRELVRHVIFAK